MVNRVDLRVVVRFSNWRLTGTYPILKDAIGTIREFESGGVEV